MSTKKNDGGQAFPTVYLPNSPGMSLRDWFAGQALAGLLGNHVVAEMLGETMGSNDGAFKHFAGAAFDYADAMLKAREA